MIRFVGMLWLVMAFLATSYQASDLFDDRDTEHQSGIPGMDSLNHWFNIDLPSTASIDASVKQQLLSRRTLECTQTNYDVTFYDLWLNVDDTALYLDGRLHLVAAATKDDVGRIQVDLLANMAVDSVISGLGTLSVSRAGDVVVVDLDHPHTSAETIDLTIFYQGTPDSTHPISAGLWFLRDYLDRPLIYTQSQPYGARSWWPCKDRRDDMCDSMAITVRASDDFYVAANGSLDSVVTPLGLSQIKDWYYFLRYPSPTDLIAVSIADFRAWYDEWVYNNGADTMPIQNVVFDDAYSESREMLAVVPDMLTFFSNLYGTYPYADCKYGHVTTRTAVEHVTMTSVVVRPELNWWFGFQERVLAHELSHSWLGDMISCESWPDVWLNEGWATYSEALYFQAKAGWNDWAAYHAYMNDRDYYDGGTIYRTDTTFRSDVYNPIVYYKGAWVLHMLRRIMGDSLFFATTGAYTQSQYAFHTINTQEFIDFWETTSGLGLRQFLEDWLYGEYRPHYLWTFLNEDNGDGTYTSYIAIDQMQTTEPQVFHMPVDVVFETEAGPRDTTVLMLDQRRKMFVRQFDDPLVHVHIDPANWVMNYQSEINWKLHFILENRLPEASTANSYNLVLETRGGTGSNTFTWVDGSLPSGMTFNAGTATISGKPTDTGQFIFTVNVDDNGSNYWDEQVFELNVIEPDLVPGDIDNSGGLDIADLVYLASYMFQGGPEPPIMNLTDVNGSCGLDIADLVYLVQYMFQSGPEPVIGCIE